MIADHEHSVHLSILAQRGLEQLDVRFDMTIHESSRICIISRAEGLSGSIADKVANPWCLYCSFQKPGSYGATQTGKPVVVDFPASMTANHFAYLCLRTLVNEWAAQLQDVPFPLGKRTITMPDGLALMPEQLALP